MTVEEYFRAIKARALRYPRIPGVKHKGAVYPLELCTVLPGQFYKKAPPPEVTSKAVEKTKMKPAQRMEEITRRFSVTYIHSNWYNVSSN